MIKTKFLIIGSGIGGLSAGAELKYRGEDDFIIIDQTASLPLNLHNGVHYLHTDNFGTPFSFELKEVVSTEQIWNPRKDEFKHRADLPEMIDYSLKVMNLRHPSSIMDPGSRPWKTYIPQSDNMNDLLSAYYEYIGKEKFIWNSKLVSIDKDNKIAEFLNINKEQIQYEYLITTVPLNIFAKLAGIEYFYDFKSQPIYATNYKTEKIVPNWLICLYISDDKFPAYRITILNNIISLESLTKLEPSDEYVLKYHLERYFDYELNTKSEGIWQTGRIWGLKKQDRKEAITPLIENNIYPLGRFGLWNGKLTMDTTILQAHAIVNGIQQQFKKDILIDILKG